MKFGLALGSGGATLIRKIISKVPACQNKMQGAK